MKYTVSYEYIDDNKVLVRTFKGNLSLIDIANCMNHDFKNGKIHHGLIGVVNNYLAAEIKIEMDDLAKIAAVFTEYQDLMLHLKWAVIVDYSIVAVPSIFKNNNPDFNLQSFTDLSSALRWVEGVS